MKKRNNVKTTDADNLLKSSFTMKRKHCESNDDTNFTRVLTKCTGTTYPTAFNFSRENYKTFCFAFPPFGVA